MKNIANITAAKKIIAFGGYFTRTYASYLFKDQKTGLTVKEIKEIANITMVKTKQWGNDFTKQDKQSKKIPKNTVVKITLSDSYNRSENRINEEKNTKNNG